jgi:hypothetical protein
MNMRQKSNVVMGTADIEWLRAFAKGKGGVHRAAPMLGVSRGTLTSVLAALPVHRGTVALLRVEIAKRSLAGKDAA